MVVYSKTDGFHRVECWSDCGVLAVILESKRRRLGCTASRSELKGTSLRAFCTTRD